MLRVGLTGGLASGKTTVARMFHKLGAHVFSADEIGRELMQPGQPVFDKIVAAFGAQVLAADGSLERSRLASIVFEDPVELQRLNKIVHPAVIAEQERRLLLLEEIEPEAIAIVESALIFEAELGGTAPDWRKRFDRIVLVTAPEEVKLARYIDKIAAAPGQPPSGPSKPQLATEAKSRIAAQISDDAKANLSDYLIENKGTLEVLAQEVHCVWEKLQVDSK